MMLSCLSRFVCKLIISGVAAVSAIILYGRLQLLPGDTLVPGGSILQVLDLTGGIIPSIPFIRYIASATTRKAGKPEIGFTKSGTLNNVELNIMNLRRGVQGGAAHQLQWEKIGAWR